MSRLIADVFADRAAAVYTRLETCLPSGREPAEYFTFRRKGGRPYTYGQKLICQVGVSRLNLYFFAEGAAAVYTHLETYLPCIYLASVSNDAVYIQVATQHI